MSLANPESGALESRGLDAVVAHELEPQKGLCCLGRGEGRRCEEIETSENITSRIRPALLLIRLHSSLKLALELFLARLGMGMERRNIQAQSVDHGLLEYRIHYLQKHRIQR